MLKWLIIFPIVLIVSFVVGLLLPHGERPQISGRHQNRRKPYGGYPPCLGRILGFRK